MLPAMVLLLLAAPPEPPKFTEAAQKELQKLEGKWDLIQIDRDGKSVTFKKGEASVTIKGTKFTAMVGDEIQSETEVVALDPRTKPACIDFKSIPRAKREGSTYEAIFKLEGEMLYYVVYNGKDKNRPTTFDPPSDSDTQLVILKRVKE